MGCAGSKQARRDRSPIMPLPRSYSLPIHHHPQRKGESCHVVALTSTTLGSLKLDTLEQNHKSISNEEEGLKQEQNHNHQAISNEEEGLKQEQNHNHQAISNEEEGLKQEQNHNHQAISNKEEGLNQETTTKTDEKSDFSTEVTMARTWSSMVQEKISKIPKTPTRTPPNEPETINMWELMEGLEGNSPLRSFSFHAFPSMTIPEPDLDSRPDSPVPLWLQTTAPGSIVADFDPDIISNFRKALEELSPPNTCRLRSPEPEKPGVAGNSRFFSKDGSVQERIRAFQERIDEGLAKKASMSLPTKCPPRGDERVVVYFTSLRGVRKTYEDCCHVRLILKGIGVRVDERDVSMHHAFREELHEMFEGGFGTLPRVFVKGMYLGGAEEVRHMHEVGELEKLLEGCEVVEDSGGACEACGDVRFVPCDTCDGSCKVYVEEEDEDGGLVGGFERCPDCNENGLITCPVCCC